MTVKELIELLNQYPDDAIVGHFNKRIDGFCEITKLDDEYIKLYQNERYGLKYGWSSDEEDFESNTYCINIK